MESHRKVIATHLTEEESRALKIEAIKRGMTFSQLTGKILTSGLHELLSDKQEAR